MSSRSFSALCTPKVLPGCNQRSQHAMLHNVIGTVQSC